MLSPGGNADLAELKVILKKEALVLLRADNVFRTRCGNPGNTVLTGEADNDICLWLKVLIVDWQSLDVWIC